MPSAGVYYDGPSFTLASGTWLIAGGVSILNAAASTGQVTVRLWDGTNVVCERGISSAVGGYRDACEISGIVVVTGPTTIKISVATNDVTGGSAAILSVASISATTQKASTITASKIA